MDYEIVDLTNSFSYDTTFCPICNTSSDIQSSQKQALTSGMAFAHCGATILQAVQCHEDGCKGVFVFCSSADDPAIDMQGLILMPSNNKVTNWIEQRELCLKYKGWNDTLKFEYCPAWDEKYVSQQQYLEYLDCCLSLIPYELNFSMAADRIVEIDKNTFLKLLYNEKTQKSVIPKRLFPNNIYYRSLLKYISEPLLTDSNPWNGWTETSEKDTRLKRSAFFYLIQYFSGKNIYKYIRKKLDEYEICYDIKDLVHEITNKIYSNSHINNKEFETIKEGLLNNDHTIVKTLFNNKFKSVYYSLCTNRFLLKYRKKLASWPEMAKQGTALFIDAPMGLGKTHSIAEGLASNPDKSAIIFMPTKRLCQELRDQLALKISFYTNMLPDSQDKIPICEDSVLEFDDNGFLIERFKEIYYTERGIYLYDGINKKECLYYNEIIERYQSGHYIKKDICLNCVKYQCRFLKHRDELKTHRIIITTHFMYDFFYRNASYRKWEIVDNNKKMVESRLRDYFIIDEDFILSNCYQPISLNEEGLINFVSTLTNFFCESDFMGDVVVDRECFQKTDLVIALAVKAKENSIIPPIDPFFEYPISIKKIWKDSQREIEEVIPDEIFFTPKTFSSVSYVGDYLEIIESAINRGFVVQSFGQIPKTVLIPNPKQYDIGKENYPAHIFSDGTRMDDKYIKNKLKGVDVKTIKIEIKKPLWQLKAFQNKNTDLPKKKLMQNLSNITATLDRIFQAHGRFEKYFIITNKQLKIEVEKFVSEYYPHHYCIIEYFGNLRGLNAAKECNIGIILGSFSLPDTVDVSLAYDFIYEKFHFSPPYPIKIFGNLWNWRGSKGTKQYKDDFTAVEDFSKMFRNSEYRQALARTRYLLHPVTFYVFSKDEVSSYEPFIDKVETDQYSSDIFPPKPRRSDNNDSEIEKKVLDYLINRKCSYVTATILQREYNLRRQTSGAHLKRMCADNKLQIAKNSKKRYEPTMEWLKKVAILY